MKNKIISLGMLVGSVVLVDCIKEKGDKYKYLSTAPVSYMVTSGASAPSGIASKNNARFDWDAFSNTITIRCDSGYGYVENSWNLASSSPDTTITATNSNGGLYTSSNFNILNAGGYSSSMEALMSIEEQALLVVLTISPAFRYLQMHNGQATNFTFILITII
jgi:hypothetical protein